MLLNAQELIEIMQEFEADLVSEIQNGLLVEPGEITAEVLHGRLIVR